MLIRITLLATCLFALSLPVMAYHCPADVKKIDAAMTAGPELSAEQLSEVKQLRTDGEADHQAGKHEESVAKLGKAMEILGVQ